MKRILILTALAVIALSSTLLAHGTDVDPDTPKTGIVSR